MAIGLRGVIETATGDLLRYGYSDLAADGAFDAATEATRTDLPSAPKRRGQLGETMMSRWTGTEWIEVAQP